jgi:hypothetical protein
MIAVSVGLSDRGMGGSELASIATNSSRIHVNRFSLRDFRLVDAFRFELDVIASNRSLASGRVRVVNVDNFHFSRRAISDFFVQVLVLDVEVGRELDFAVVVGRRHDGGREQDGFCICTAGQKCLPELACRLLLVLSCSTTGSIQNGILERGVDVVRQLEVGGGLPDAGFRDLGVVMRWFVGI